jgi:shikimate kinase / 3-dehydroquinate synthase
MGDTDGTDNADLEKSEVKRVVLTGFMGTGKSSAGRLLAKQTGRRFVDTDEWIEERAGLTIAEIFEQHGEAHFRRLEALAAVELAVEEDLVVATGGRLMLDPANGLDLGRDALVVCLTAEPEEILARLAHDLARRPLLDVPRPEARIRQLLEERAERYGRFHQISTSGKEPAAVAAEIVALLEDEERFLPPKALEGGPERISVRYPGGRYDVLVGYDLLPRLGELAGIRGAGVIVTDSNVGPLYAGQCGGFEAAGTPIVLPAGEAHKRLATVQAIYEKLLAAGLDRQGSVVALGGGVVGDVAGFAAATYLRGVNFVQCPTSLLAMVDASVGGKTGVDMPQGKNLVGAFKQPAAVVADLSTLATLPADEFSAGLAEVVKHGLIASPAIMAQLKRNDYQPPVALCRLGADNYPLHTPDSLILRAIQVKRDVVEADPFEMDRRAWLNLGHTFGHAIEQVSNYAVRHGDAVAMGLVAAAHLSALLGHAAPALQEEIETLLTRLNLPIRIPTQLQAGALLQAMATDKKRAAGKLRFVLIREVGDVFVSGDVPETAVLTTLRALTSS